MPFGLWARVNPVNHMRVTTSIINEDMIMVMMMILDRGSRSPHGRGNLEGEGAAHCKV